MVRTRDEMVDTSPDGEMSARIGGVRRKYLKNFLGNEHRRVESPNDVRNELTTRRDGSMLIACCT